MKNQYNLMHSTQPISNYVQHYHHNNSINDTPDVVGEKQQVVSSNNVISSSTQPTQHQFKGSLSKLHNLVSSSFLKASSTSPQHHQEQREKGAARRWQHTSSRQDEKKMQTAAISSEKMAPELAKCYDEIDQIYDYIRGLAPLPVQLRKIKSIDFEQLDRQAAAAASRPPRPRQREATEPANGEGAARPPTVVSASQARVQGPLTVRQLNSTEAKPVSVKRVESLNLGVTARKLAATSNLQNSQRASGYLQTSSRQINNNINGGKPFSPAATTSTQQMFRLPRAHSASTLNRPLVGLSVPHLLRNQTNKNSEKHTSDKTQTSNNNDDKISRTLPATRTSRVSEQTKLHETNSLGRQQQQQHPLPANNRIQEKPLDLVESFVDDDDISSVHSSATQDLSSSSSTSSSSSQSKQNRLASSIEDEDSSSFNQEAKSSSSSSSSSSLSHSDYENETAASSLTESSSTSRSSSNSSSLENKDDHKVTSKNGSQQKRVAPASHSNKKSEHIYEQIPAHSRAKSTQRQSTQELNNTNKSSPPTDTQQRLKSPYREYPVAYAPTVAATRVQPERPRILLGHPTPVMFPFQRLNQLNMQHSKRPSIPADSYHRHRLSMNNLHLLPYLKHPSLFVGSGGGPSHNLNHHNHHHQQQQQSGSTRALHTSGQRAPRLSPTQLIAQIQMPRAVSKRQSTLYAMGTGGGSQFTAPQVATSQPHTPSSVASSAVKQQQQQQQQQQQPMLVCWRDQQVVDQAKLPALRTKAPSMQRNGARRLTAIGIESVVEAREFGTRFSAFEPGQLIACKAPPIDAFNDSSSGSRSGAPPNTSHHQRRLMGSRCLNSVSDLRASSSCDEDGSSSMTRSPSSQSSASSSSSDDEVNRSHQQTRNQGSGATTGASTSEGFVSSRSFIKCYYGRRKGADDSSNNTNKQQVPTDTSKAPSLRKRRSEKLLGLIGIQPAKTRNRDQQVTDHSRFSSRDHQENEHSARHRRHRIDDGETAEFLSSEGPILIRDRRIAALRSNLVRHYQHPTVQVSELPVGSARNRTSTTAAQQQQQQQQQPKYAPKAALASDTTSNSTSSYEAAIKNSRKQHTKDPLVVMESLDSASQAVPPAIQQQRKRTSIDQQQTSSSTNNRTREVSSNSKGIVSQLKVPKLCKQSHLLNRPLPRPPSGSSRQQVATGGTSGGSHSQRFLEMIQQQQQEAATLSGVGQPRPLNSSLTPSKRRTQLKDEQLKDHSVVGTQPSPTVTTCTSSGISSRLTSATQLIHSSGSSQRSSANPADLKSRGFSCSSSSSSSNKCPSSSQDKRVKSLSELHKQAKRQNSLEKKQSDERDATCESNKVKGEELVAAAAVVVETKSKTKSETETVNGNEIGDENENGNASPMMSNNLRLFDERFSSGILDKQLASSEDSLLESINFSGTLNRKRVD